MFEYLQLKFASGPKLSEAALEQWRVLCEGARTLPPQKHLIREGELADQVPVLLQGWAVRYALLSGGDRQITGFMLPGDIGQRHSTLLKRSDHSILALTPCTVSYISEADLEQAVRFAPDLQRALAWCAMVEESMLRSWVVNVGRRDGYSRIAHLVCEIHARLEAIGMVEERLGGGCEFEFPVTQEELADSCGLTPVHTNRILQKLRGDGLMDLRYRRASIFDLQGLQATADFDPKYLHVQPTEGLELA